MIEKIIKSIESSGKSQAFIAKELGIHPQNFNRMLKNDDIKLSTLIKIANIIEIPIYDIINNDDKIIDKKKHLIPQKPPTGIPLIPIEAMAGYGNGEFVVDDNSGIERFVVPTFKGADYLISVKGSSMYPKYNSGDIVACKKLNINDIFFQWNKVYVLDTEQGALIKRVCKAKDDKHILCVSDNNNYGSFELHRSKINAIAIVMGVIRLE